eukprot:2036837-Pyramimonas_sp.AAC.1
MPRRGAASRGALAVPPRRKMGRGARAGARAGTSPLASLPHCEMHRRRPQEVLLPRTRPRTRTRTRPPT